MFSRAHGRLGCVSSLECDAWSLSSSFPFNSLVRPWSCRSLVMFIILTSVVPWFCPRSCSPYHCLPLSPSVARSVVRRTVLASRCSLHASSSLLPSHLLPSLASSHASPSPPEQVRVAHFSALAFYVSTVPLSPSLPTYLSPASPLLHVWALRLLCRPYGTSSTSPF